MRDLVGDKMRVHPLEHLLRQRWRVHLSNLRGLMLAAAVWGALLVSAPEPQAQLSAANNISVQVTGENHQPLAGATVEGRSDSALLCNAVTDVHGQAERFDQVMVAAHADQALHTLG